MKLILAVLAVSVMSGCSSTQLRTGCMWDCDKWERWEREAAQKKVDNQANLDRWLAERQAERQANLDKLEALQQAKLAQCSSFSRNPTPVSDAVRRGVEARYKEQLKDPYSAHFRNIQEASAWAQCMGRAKYKGEVNSKNSYGGYVGYMEFTTN
jgi:hypothetical protein